jgi:hypothetical protein
VNWLYHRKHGCTAAIHDNQALPLLEVQQMKRQATKANRAQIEHHIKRQRAGLPADFAHAHPVIDAMIGGLILAAGFGGMIAIWISVGAGV